MAFEPIPGDPGAIRSAAGSLSSLAHDVSDSAGQIGSVAGEVIGSWQGQSADHFESLSGRVTTSHRTAGELLSDVASALVTYAGKLEDAQAKQRQAEAMADSAVADAGAAIARLAVTFAVSEFDVLAGVVPSAVASDVQGAKRSIDATLSAGSAAAQQLQIQAEEEFQAASAVLRAALHEGLSMAHTLGTDVVSLGNALSIPSTVWTGVSTIAFFRALYQWGTLGEKIPGAIAEAFSDGVGPMALAFDRGEVTYAELAERADSFMKNASIFEDLADHDAIGNVAEGGMDLGRIGGVGLGALSLVGDAATVISPMDSGGWGWADRGAAVANAAGTGVGILGAVGVIDASTGWIPVAGQVVVIASGVYLAGDFLYHTVTPFRDAVNDTGHFIASAATDTIDLGESAVSTGVHVVGDVTGAVSSTVSSTVSTGLHAAESIGSGAAHAATSAVSDVAGFFGL